VIDRHTNLAQKYYFNMAITLPFATNSTLTISNTAIDILKKLCAGNETMRFKKAGVIVTGLIPEDSKQFHLFEDENPKHINLMKTIDSLNKKMGDKKIKLASQNLNLTWDMNQNYLSPKYTTNFKQILEINVNR
jgi:DNA polymerase V